MLERLVTVNDYETNKIVRTLPRAVANSIIETLEILDENYGSNRSKSDMGGYVIVITTVEERKEVALEDKIDFHNDIFEYVDLIPLKHSYNWVKILLIKSSDYHVVIYMPHTLMTMHIMEYLEGNE